MKRQVDHAALAARWQREAQENLYRTDDAAPLATRQPANYVAPPAAPATLRTLPSQDTAQTIDVLPAASVQTTVRTSQVDHSKGFLLRSLPYALGFGLTACIFAAVGLGVPVLSLQMLLVLFLAFSVTYAWLFWQDLRASPAGVALYHTQHLWKHIHAERKFRHKWYENERKEIRRR